MNELSAGSVLDGFLIGRSLYSGAMARIYEVSYADGRPAPFPMVMKVPRMTLSDGGENITGFEVEHQMMQMLSGPHVPRFVAAGDIREVPYIVMEHLEGRTLEKWSEESLADLTMAQRVERIAHIGAQLADAIHSLHQQNACHLDLKPANVILLDSGSIVLLDFGLSYHGDYPDLLAEEFRHAVGSPAYMSPEQVVGTRGDPRSDLFAIGVMLYEMVCGVLPFGAPSTKGGLRQRLWMAPTPPRARNHTIPDWLQEIILTCLEPQADMRYPSAAHLAFDLRNPKQVGITGRGRSTESLSPWEHFRRWIRAIGLHYEPSPLPRERIQEAPLIMVGLPSRNAKDTALWGLRLAANRALGNRPGARIAVVMVLRPSETSYTKRDQSETAMYRSYLARMKAWANGLKLDSQQITFHVLESDDVAGALLQYAEQNKVTLIILGAATQGLRVQRFVATIPIRVAMYAPCTVTLVREDIPFQKLAQDSSEVRAVAARVLQETL